MSGNFAGDRGEEQGNAGRPRRILIVCTGNVCRSPMAAGLLRQRLAADGLDNTVEVRSAGLWGLDGEPASAHAVQVMAERGVDISDHRARTLREHDVAAADLILTMEESHRRAIFHVLPAALRKVFLLSEMAGEHDDVDDPYGLPLEAYRASAEELARLISQGYPEILRRLGLSTGPSARHPT
ncbi:MAG: low molecular weight protein arginine phosphatase [Anaerolineae bacterium]|nr:low molecular weight protein arginine phosphatase [Anaerolineae bacterium]